MTTNKLNLTIVKVIFNYKITKTFPESQEII